MIEEEDNDEEVLKKGITLKSALKNIVIVLFILAGVLIIYLGFSPNQMLNWAIGFSLICIGTTFMQIQKHPPEPLRQTLTILICSLCGLTKVRNYEQGDFIFQKRDSCEKCNQSMEVKQIYTVKLKRPTETKKKKDGSELKKEVKK
jgi:hypothetical protein